MLRDKPSRGGSLYGCDIFPGMNSGIYSDHSAEFHLAEYNALRSEVLHLLETLRSLERNIVVAVGVSWAFLIEKRAETPRWSWFIPVFFAVLGVWRVRGILKFFGQFREYLASLEESFHVLDGPIGWQHFSRPPDKDAEGEKDPEGKKTRKAKKGSEHSISDGTVAFWTTLLSATLVAAIYEAFFAYIPKCPHLWF
jgi:hypothetical protein